jgi:hypothetical protein
MAKVETVKITALKGDPHNANKGTPRGMGLLEQSLKENGAGRSILLDSEGGIIAGNKTYEKAGEAGFEDVIVVHTTGRELVAVQRDDVEPDSPERTMMALRDNRVGEVNLDWNAEQLAGFMEAGVDLSEMWREEELQEILSKAAETVLNDGKEYDESIENEVEYLTCPACGHRWPR